VNRRAQARFVGPAAAMATAIGSTRPTRTTVRSREQLTRRRGVEAGRAASANVQRSRDGGLEGDLKLGEQKFNWDATLAYGINHAISAATTVQLGRRRALGPAFAGAACGSWDDGEAGDPNCVPFNLRRPGPRRFGRSRRRCSTT
jgi:hypothetical protein